MTSGGGVRLREAVGLSVREVAAVQAQVRRRVLRWFVRRGCLEDADWWEMQRWAHSAASRRVVPSLTPLDLIDHLPALIPVPHQSQIKSSARSRGEGESLTPT